MSNTATQVIQQDKLDREAYLRACQDYTAVTSAMDAAALAQLAIAGSLLGKRRINESAGTLRTDTVTFMVVLIFIVYIFAALTFFPALALGPIAEHLSLWL